MKNFRLLPVLGLGIAVAGITCAPVVPQTGQEKKGANTQQKAENPVSSPAVSDPTRRRIEAALEQVKGRELQTTNGFWTVFHGILGLGPSITLTNPETGQSVNALDYMANGGELRGLRFVPSPDGLDVETKPGLFISQGHQDQFIAEMVQWGVPADKKFVVNGKDYTFRDFLNHSKMRVSLKEPQELEWALVIIGQHFGTDAAWTNSLGEKLKFEDLLRKELSKPVEDNACGGTHKLFGLAWVYHLHLARGGKTEGVWKDVADRLDEYKMRARNLQNSNGAFSTEFFRGRGDDSDMKLRINTTGHTLEWLALTLSDEELKEQWVADAANALSLMFLEIRGQPMEGGSLYHATHGLLLYYSRLYGADKLGTNAPPMPPAPKTKATPKLPVT